MLLTVHASALPAHNAGMLTVCFALASMFAAALAGTLLLFVVLAVSWFNEQHHRDDRRGCEDIQRRER